MQINSDNKDDIAAAISNVPGVTVSGTITYNPESNVLTLDNASIIAYQE